MFILSICSVFVHILKKNDKDNNLKLSIGVLGRSIFLNKTMNYFRVKMNNNQTDPLNQYSYDSANAHIGIV